MTQKEEVPQTEHAEIEQLIEQVKQSNLEQSAVDKLERLLRPCIVEWVADKYRRLGKAD